MSEPNAETPVHERFVIRERLGSGGMGVVYAAYDRDRDETVALKTLRRRDAASLYSFKKEFRTLADVAHPNLVSLYELIADDDRWFFTMELIEGTSFIDYVLLSPKPSLQEETAMISVLTETMPLDTAPASFVAPLPTSPLTRPADEIAFDETRLRAALRQLAIGVRALHNAGKMHRDLKPHNVLVTNDGRVVILDFGIAREVASTLSQLTAEAGFLGTLAYMSPEQARGADSTPASDWYAVGVMLFEALTGRLPFTGTLSRVLAAKLHHEAPSPRSLAEGLPPDLVELCEGLLERDAAQRPTGADVLRRLGGGDTPLPDQSYLRIEPMTDQGLTGRQRHLATLESAFIKTLEGQATTVHVHGSSGMGKTAIVHALLRRLIKESRAVVLPGRCYVRELVPYKALDGVVDSLSKYLLKLPRHDVEVLLPREIQALARVFPVLSRIEAIAETSLQGRGVTDRLPLRRLAFGALRELLGRIAEQQPVVLFIDDLQWADADSTALLADLLRPPDPPPLLLVTCFRSEEIGSQSFLEDLVSATGREDCIELEAGPLSPEDATELIRAYLGHRPEAELLVRGIAREARGSPFLIEQLSGYALTSDAGLTQTGLDRRVTLAEMLDQRIRHAPAGAESLLLVLAAAGQPIAATVAYEAAGLEGSERPLLAALQAGHLIRSSGSANSVELYHNRIGENLAGRVSRVEGQQIHRRIATALINHGLDDPEALFSHYRGAGDSALAAEQALLAARKASDALAFDRATLFYQRALDQGPFDDEERAQLQRELADTLAYAGRPSNAASTFLRLAERSEGMAALELRSRAAQEYLAGGYFDQGLAELRTVFAAVGLDMAKSPAGAILSLLWQRLRLRLRPRGFDFTPRSADQIPTQDLLRIDVCYTAAASLVTADTVRGADFQTRQLRLALRIGEPLRVARAMGLEVSYRATAGVRARKQATRLLERTVELARLVDDPFTTGLCHLHAGLMAYCFGDWVQSADRCEEAEALFTEQCTGAIWEVTFVRRYHLSALMHQGELAAVGRQLPDLLAEADERGNALAAANLRTRLGIVWLAADDPTACHREVERALRTWSQEGFHVVHYNGLISRCLADLYAGEDEAAFRRLIDTWPEVQRSYVPRIQVARIEMLFLRARCALAATAAGVTQDRPRREALRAAAKIAREKLHYGQPMVELIHAGLAQLDGDRAEATSGLQRAALGFEAVDMHLFAAATRRRLGELTQDEDGRDQVDKANAWMKRQKILRPDRMTAILAPGFARTC